MKTEFDRKEAENLIGRAAEIDRDASEKLSRVEVVTAAKEVGVSEAAVREAEREKENAEVRRTERITQAKRLITIVGALLIALGVGFQLSGISARSHLSVAWERVQRRHADVRSAMQRRDAVAAFWASVQHEYPDSCDSTTCYQMRRDRDVEIAGAQNRVTVAMRRYDIDVSEYNALQSDAWSSSREFTLHAPYSNEVTQW